MSNPSWLAPDRQICDALNAPAAVAKFFLLKGVDKWFPNHSWFEFVIETIVYIGLIALLWYVVSLEMTSGKKNWLSAMTSKVRLRVLADLLLILFGVTVAFVGGLVRHQFILVSTYSDAIALPYFIWATILVVFYTHDLWSYFSGKAKSEVKT